MISSNQEIAEHTNLRFGHAIPTPVPWGVAKVEDGRLKAAPGAHRRPCPGRSRGGRFRHKAIEVSNMFRQALGLPLIETAHHHHHRPNKGDGNKFQMLPFIGTPPTFIELKEPGVSMDGKTRGGDAVHIFSPQTNRWTTEGIHYSRPKSFSGRLHRAIMSLGAWEGRAMAFVFGMSFSPIHYPAASLTYFVSGCGIGVLIRMFFVLALVAFRSFKGKEKACISLEDVDEQRLVVDAVNAETTPPTYTYADEKTSIEDAKTAEEQTK